MDVQTRVGMPMEDFIRQYEEAPFELVDGERIPLMPPVGVHIWMQKLVYDAISAFEQTIHLGVVFMEAPFVLADIPDWVKGSRVPDVSFYRVERWSAYINANPDWLSKPFVLVPDLCVEIISATDNYLDVDAKVAGYLRDGVRLVWVFNPREKAVFAHTSSGSKRLTETDMLDGGEVLPGFSLPLAAIFI